MPHPAPGDWPENRVVARLPGSPIPPEDEEDAARQAEAEASDPAYPTD